MAKRTNPELKTQAIETVQKTQHHYPSTTAAAQAVAHQLGLNPHTLRKWVTQTQNTTNPPTTTTTTTEQIQIKALKAKIRQLEHDNAILRLATTFFATGPTPQPLTTPPEKPQVGCVPSTG